MSRFADLFVKNMSVNGHQLPPSSHPCPCLHRPEKICSFADVKESPGSRPQRLRAEAKSFISYTIQIMARSKTGGSRAYLRGRVGSDVYSIGKDAKGKKQQVVRSLAESVKNPQTVAQMRGRMIMSTIMQAVAGMRSIIDHSFDNVPAGQPNISEFIKRNYALIKADVAANHASGNAFGLNKYQEKGVKAGAYVIGSGSAIAVKGIAIDGANKTLTIDLTGDVTIGGLKAALGINIQDYFTICSIVAGGKFAFERFHITNELGDDTEITASNIAQVFTLDGNTSVTLALNGSSIVATLADMSANCAIITTRKQESGYIHSDAVLAVPSTPQYTADVALPTYPTGEERFLNGGGEEGGDVPFVPEPFVVALVSATANGSNWAKNATVNAANPRSCAVTVQIDNYKNGHRLFFGSRYDASNPANNRGFFINGLNASGTIASLTGTDNTPETNDIWLWLDGVQLEKWGAITFSNEVVQYNISASVDPVGSGSVTGAGTYNDGASCTLVATPASGKVFQGWYNGAQLVSSSANYSFVVTGNLSLTAKFGDEPVAGFENVMAGSHNWNQNLSVEDVQAGNYKPVTGTYTGDRTGKRVAVVANYPQVGQKTGSWDSAQEIGNDGSFSITPSFSSSTANRLVAGTESDGQILVTEMYEYNISLWSE